MHWHFGYNCSLDFTSGTPVWSGNSPIYTEEGSSSISDSAGNFLFSVQGTQIYDKNGNPMPGGNQLKGSTSSTQNSLIVPFVDDTENRYYHVFTVAAQNDYWPSYEHTGLEHCIVDMQSNNGLGSVIQASSEIIPWVAEKIHATKHRNGHDVWVVVRGMNSSAYYAVLIDCKGLNTPIVSQTNFFLSTNYESIASQGALKLSPDGSKIACTYSPVLDSNWRRNLAILEFAAFDNQTGIVSNVDTLQVSYPTNQMVLAYGLEFSPDNSKLYWTVQKYLGDLFQFDYNAPNFKASRTHLGYFTPSIASMQLGPDNKIYISQSGGSQQLKVIHNPNQSPANLSIGNGPSVQNYLTHGLPNMWRITAAPQKEHLYDSLYTCPENSIQLLASEKLTSFEWNTGNLTNSLYTQQEGDYFVHEEKCPRDTHFFHVEVKDTCICELYVPNVFTPNGDGLNEGFKAESDCDLSEFRMQIFNRWGELVFESNDIQKAWEPHLDGIKSDMYVYMIDYAFEAFGVKKRSHKTGHVMVLY